jgi:hypothetical protein
VNFATEPVTVGEVRARGFGRAFANELAREPARYDFRTRHDRLFGGAWGYMLAKPQVLAELRSFVAAQREGRRCA